METEHTHFRGGKDRKRRVAEVTFSWASSWCYLVQARLLLDIISPKKHPNIMFCPVLDTLEKVAAAGWKRNIISMLFFYSKQSNNKRIKSGRDWNGVLGSFALGRSLRPDNTLWNYNFMGQKHNPTMKYSLCVAWWYREVSWKSHRFAVVPEKGALFAQKTQVVWCCPPVSTCLRWWLLESAHKIHWKYTDSFIVQPNCSRHLSLSMGIWVHLPKKGNGVTNPTPHLTTF